MNWISVTDRFPIPNTKVLVCRVGNKSNSGVFFAIHKNRDINPWEYLDGDTCYIRITHWMHIPPLPEKI